MRSVVIGLAVDTKAVGGKSLEVLSAGATCRTGSALNVTSRSRMLTDRAWQGTGDQHACIHEMLLRHADSAMQGAACVPRAYAVPTPCRVRPLPLCSLGIHSSKGHAAYRFCGHYKSML